jgi:tRNA dimethylallyltransferase
VGKSAFCLRLAEEIGGEIVNADAVQVYRGFDVGSAKPSVGERERVPHHLLDVADPDMEITVATYQLLAHEAIREVERRGAVPIVSGGSGLYLRAALGEWEAFGAPPDPEVRRWAETADIAEVYGRAMAVDPLSAQRLSPQDRPRLIRVIERSRAAGGGRVASSMRFLKIGLQLPRAQLYARIDERALTLWPHLLRETSQLITRGPQASALVERTIGYREALRHLRGETGPEEAMRQVQMATRHLAKRQLTWWRREPDTIWLRPDEGMRQLRAML